MIEYGETKTKVFLAKKTHLPTKTFRLLAKSDELVVLMPIAENPNTPSEVLRQLANSNQAKVIGIVGRHPNTPQDILEELAKHHLHFYRTAVAHNPSTPQYLLEKLMSDDLDWVRKVAASNLDKYIAHKPIEEILQTQYGEEYLYQNPEYIQDNPNSKTAILRNYARSQSWLVGYIALLEDRVSAEVLEEQSYSEIWLKRFAVAQNGNTSINTLNRLEEDYNRLVRAAAEDNIAKRKQ